MESHSTWPGAAEKRCVMEDWVRRTCKNMEGFLDSTELVAETHRQKKLLPAQVSFSAY